MCRVFGQRFSLPVCMTARHPTATLEVQVDRFSFKAASLLDVRIGTPRVFGCCFVRRFWLSLHSNGFSLLVDGRIPFASRSLFGQNP